MAGRKEHTPGSGETPTGPANVARVLELHEQGKGRNEISREVGIGLATVSRIVKQAGLSFDRSRVAAATEARTIDNRARRSELAGELLTKAQQMLAMMDGPFTAFAFGGRDNLERHDADQGAESAKSLLADFGRALGVKAPDA
jgi:hypothetical protein